MAPLRVSTLVADQFRILTFRAPSAAIAEHRAAYLVFGLVTAWIAGIGRYWDHPSADWWQYAGTGSVLYVPVLATLIWCVARPIARKPLPCLSVLTFVSLTSLPALLYATPVERFMSPEAARAANGWFLIVVAAWRVALLCVFLYGAAGLRGARLIIGAFLPLTLVVVTLAQLNLEHAVFQFMASPKDRLPPTPNDYAYKAVVALSLWSFLAFFPLAASWVWLCVERLRSRLRSRELPSRP